MKRILRQAFLLPGWVVAVLTIVCAIAQTIALSGEGRASPLACAVYAVSAYTTVILAIRLPAATLRARRWLYQHKTLGRYIAQPEARAETSLHVSLALNIAFALYYVVNALLTQSPWYVSAAIYYALLAAVRLLLLRGAEKAGSTRETWIRYILCGCVLLTLTVALAAMCAYTILMGRRPPYPGHLIYAVALYTFSHIALAALNLKRYPRHANPIYAASKAVSFAAALVSVFFLQSALISSFGYSKAFFYTMSVAMGGSIMFIIALMAIRMIVLGMRELMGLALTEDAPTAQES